LELSSRIVGGLAGEKALGDIRRTSGAGECDMMTDELRRVEEERRVSVAMGRPQQGAWTTWEAVDPQKRQVKRSVLWSMEQLRVSILLHSVYDLLPTTANLYSWKLSESNVRARCCKTGSLEHILAGCNKSLRQYTWRHNQVLEVLTSAAENHYQSKVSEPSKKGIVLVTYGIPLLVPLWGCWDRPCI